MEIVLPKLDDNPSDRDVYFLDDRIKEFNEPATGITDGRLVSWFLRDERGEIIAGLYGLTWSGACEVRCLWVREDCRKRAMALLL
jgi:hypothetical protein